VTVYLITGGAGFIGSHLAETLLRRGERVRILDNFSTGKRDHLALLREIGGDLTIHEGSITDAALVREVMAGVDYVLHQAALPSVPRSVADPLETHEVCATGTLNILIAARDAGVKRLIYASSSAVYGDLPGDYKMETMLPQTLSPYAAAKLAGEYYCRTFTAVYGLETVALRYFNVFGERQDPDSPYAAVIPLFIRAMLRGERPTIYGDGTQTRDFVHVADIVAGNLRACHAEPSAAGAAYNLAGGSPISLLDLIAHLNGLLGTAITPIFAAERPGDIKHSCADIRRAGDRLGDEPQVGLAEGLGRTLAWFQQRLTLA